MKILLDENMPESLMPALRRLGHQVDSINRIGYKGIADMALYREVAKDYDLCFTRDIGFAHNVRQMRAQAGVKLLRVTLPEQRTALFVPRFIQSFEQSDWSNYSSGSDWP